MVAPYFLALFMGALLAIITRPAYESLRRKKFGAKLASVSVVLSTLVVVVTPASAIAFLAIKQAVQMGKLIVSNSGLLPGYLSRVANSSLAKAFIDDPADLQQKISGWVHSGAESATTYFVALVGAMPELILQIALGILAMFFLLIDGKRFVSWLKAQIPLDSEVRESLVASIRFTAVSTIWATLSAGLAQSALMLVAFLSLGVPQAFLAAGCTFVFAWVPLLGSTPVWISGIIFLWFKGSIAKVFIMLVFGLVTGVIDNFVRAMIFRGQGDMHPLVSLIAIFGGIHLFGIWGVFLGPVIIAILLALLNVWPKVARHAGIMGDEKSGLTDASGVLSNSSPI